MKDKKLEGEWVNYDRNASDALTKLQSADEQAVQGIDSSVLTGLLERVGMISEGTTLSELEVLAALEAVLNREEVTSKPPSDQLMIEPVTTVLLSALVLKALRLKMKGTVKMQQGRLSWSFEWRSDPVNIEDFRKLVAFLNGAIH